MTTGSSKSPLPYPMPMDELEMMAHGYVDKKCRHHAEPDKKCECKNAKLHTEYPSFGLKAC